MEYFDILKKYSHLIRVYPTYAFQTRARRSAYRVLETEEAFVSHSKKGNIRRRRRRWRRLSSALFHRAINRARGNREFISPLYRALNLHSRENASSLRRPFVARPNRRRTKFLNERAFLRQNRAVREVSSNLLQTFTAFRNVVASPSRRLGSLRIYKRPREKLDDC